ncbi:MAG: 30S ribosomal protein S6 [Patescibacteria group bacterium]
MNHKEHTEPRVYELGYHLVPTVSEEQIPGISGAVRGMIEKNSKEVISEELPVFIDLAYQVIKTVEHKNKRFDEAYFGWIKFEGSPEGIAVIEEGLKNNENVLRYIIVKTLRESTYLSKKFPSSNAKNREENIAPEEVVVAGEIAPALKAASSEPEVTTDEELDKVIGKLVS